MVVASSPLSISSTTRPRTTFAASPPTRAPTMKSCTSAEIDKMIDRLHKKPHVREQESFPFDHLKGTVRSFDDAMVIHFLCTQERGTVITLEPEVARQFNTFIGRCLQRIRG